MGAAGQLHRHRRRARQRLEDGPRDRGGRLRPRKRPVRRPPDDREEPARRIGVFEGGGRDPRDSPRSFSRSIAFLVELSRDEATTVAGGDDAATRDDGSARRAPGAARFRSREDHRRRLAHGYRPESIRAPVPHRSDEHARHEEQHHRERSRNISAVARRVDPRTITTAMSAPKASAVEAEMVASRGSAMRS